MTQKQKRASELLVGNGGNVTQAMIDAGYSPETAHTPGKLTNSKGFKELVEVYIPDDKLLQKHQEALEANRQIGAMILIDADGEVIKKENEGMIEVPDHQVRLKAVELGYKVKGKLSTDTPFVAVQVNTNLDKLAESIIKIATSLKHG